VYVAVVVVLSHFTYVRIETPSRHRVRAAVKAIHVPPPYEERPLAVKLHST
jgi:hypothetical protein